MQKKIKKIFVVILLVVIFAAICFIFQKKYTARLDNQKAQLAQEVEQKAVLEKLNNTESEKPADANLPITKKEPGANNIPKKFLLDIPFYSQAPFYNWDSFHEDMCEEASVLNAAYYLLNKKPSKEKYEAELQKMQNAEKKEIGEWKSTTVSQIKKLIDIYFEGKIKSKIVDNPTAEQIESEISAGNPVIIPLAGRDIGNPNYRQPGPIYHMLIIKGYDEKYFITNDVGTRKGNSYVYKKETIMKNIHDWNETDIHKGMQKILVIYK